MENKKKATPKTASTAKKKDVVSISSPKRNTTGAKKKTVAITPKKKVLFVASECTPFMATGGLAEVIGSLSKTLAKDENYDVRVIMPLYSEMKEDHRHRLQYLGNIFVSLSWRNQYCGIFSYEENGVTFYFLDNEYYFKRQGCYGYYDDAERFAFFSKSVLDVMPFIGFYPDIMHCHDWQSALSVLYLKTMYCQRPEYQFIRAIFTIHNIEYQGQYGMDVLGDVFGIPSEYHYLFEYHGGVNLMKGAIECAETFSTVSPRYASEIKTAEYAHGLEEIIVRNHFKLRGILNGIDVDFYNSENDPSLPQNFTAEDLTGKAICKRELQKSLGLPERDVPMIAMITRLVSHKGLDLVCEVLENILQEDVQFVLLGTGDKGYEDYFKAIAERYSDKMKAMIIFNGALSRKIYGGADLFLMPSKSEPCGLSQMIASRYATVPIVRETGGLYDSIRPYGAGGNGFTFSSYNAYDMLYVIHEGLDLYKKKEAWNELLQRVLKEDFSWNRSSEEYKKLYTDTLNLKK